MGQRFCKQCGEDISNRDRHNKFCNRSCAAKYNNSAGLTGRKGKPVSDEARWRMSEGMCETYRKQGKEAHSHPNTSDRKCKYEECGKTFAPDRPGRLYCSNRCRILGAGKSVRGRFPSVPFRRCSGVRSRIGCARFVSGAKPSLSITSHQFAAVVRMMSTTSSPCVPTITRSQTSGRSTRWC